MAATLTSILSLIEGEEVAKRQVRVFYLMKLVFLFAPGAGAASTHPWMQRWKQRLIQIGDVETFDYDYMREARKRPDRLPQLIAAHRAAFAEVRAETSGSIILIGK